jgi:8-oxo-dGTP pyrophosphatase MutT (NUDIX family)
VREPQGRAAHVAARAPRRLLVRRSTRPEPARSAARRRLLRRRLPQPLALTARFPRLTPRLHARPDDGADPALLWAAVAAIVVPDPDSILLIRRAERDGDPWSGHMALPGGRRDAADGDLVETAIRETWEEVGVVLGRRHLLGALEAVAPRTPTLPPVGVVPIVFSLPFRPSLCLNAEVSSAHWVELETLADPATHRDVTIAFAEGARSLPAYVVEAGVVWGLTERILQALLES